MVDPVTVTLQIGNSDDKLTQKEWSDFVSRMEFVVRQFAAPEHFFGSPPNYMPWQNVCWVFSMPWHKREALVREVTRLRTEFRQHSAAVTFGETKFV